MERKKAAVKRCEDQLLKMELQATDREENKQIALGTSKLNYLDPRISVAWLVQKKLSLCKVKLETTLQDVRFVLQFPYETLAALLYFNIFNLQV